MDFIQQAYKGKNKWWMWLLTASIIMYPFFKGLISYVLYYKPVKNAKQFTGDIIPFLVKSLLSSTGFLILLLLSVKFLHKRALKTVITSKKNIRWSRFFFGLSSWGFTIMVYLSISYINYPDAYVLNFKPIPFLILFLVCFTLVPIRASFLEILFRGYLMQGVGMLTKNRWAPLLFTSILFMILFGMNPMLNKLGYELLIFYFATGLLSGMITLLDEGIELAMGMHVANNIISLLYITTTWAPYQTNALLLDVSPPKLLYLLYIPVFVFFPLYLFLLKKIYNWTNWKEKLTGHIYKPSYIEKR